MSPLLDHPRSQIVPVTALAFFQLGSKLSLLIGKGPYVIIYDAQAQQPICAQTLFDGKNIHGVKTGICEAVTELDHCRKRLLAWAGNSICTAIIESCADGDNNSKVIIRSVFKLDTNDWILDACLQPNPIQTYPVKAIFVTSHNRLHCMIQAKGDDDCQVDQATTCEVAAGPDSLLYCAHLDWPDHGHGTVAVGTAFGDVLFWSFPTHTLSQCREFSVSPYLHSNLHGHEGSVFGVRFTNCPNAAIGKSARCYIASCSDDRTISLWDVTGWDDDITSEPSQSGEKADNSHGRVRKSGQPVASVMGHISRIWGIRFIRANENNLYILSYGEDCSTQLWRFWEKLRVDASLEQGASFAFHSGKNIWAVDTWELPSSEQLIVSGGADGRIACYTLAGSTYLPIQFSQCQYTVEDVRRGWQGKPADAGDVVPQITADIDPRPIATRIFTLLKGEWKLERTLDSNISSYPTGVFKGTATFQQRNPTDQGFDLEYLYIEEGQFTTQQGLNFIATRRYVYRLQERCSEISAWFVKPDDGVTVDYLFHVLQPQGKAANVELSLRAHHLCSKDDYWVEYVFPLQEFSFEGFDIKYIVKGPGKDYVTHTRYTPVNKTPIIIQDTQPCQLQSDACSKRLNPSIHATSGLECPIESLDAFKAYAWLDETTILVTTERGWLLQGSLDGEACIDRNSKVNKDGGANVAWSPIVQEPRLRSICIVSSIRAYGVTLLSGQDGTVFYFRGATGTVQTLTKLPRKIACLEASDAGSTIDNTSEESFEPRIVANASCIGAPVAYHMVFIPNDHDNTFQYVEVQLELPDTFIPTSTLFIKAGNIVVLGSRKGTLAVFLLERAKRIEHVPVTPELVTTSLHGGETVTTLIVVPMQNVGQNSELSYILSAGRDGKYLVHLLTVRSVQESQNRVSHQTVHSSSLPPDTCIEGARFCSQSHDLALWGFRSKDFAVWNDRLKCDIMSIECGGAHRNWAFLPTENGIGEGNLVWTKASTLHIYSQQQASHQVLAHGGHGREIKATALSPPIEEYDGARDRYLVTGAEDTKIRIWKLCHEDQSGEDLRCIHILSKHTTGIQQLRWSSNGRYLFSVAGREELYVWQIQPVPYFDIGVICVSACPPISESHDLRIMDLDLLEFVAGGSLNTLEYVVATVYSDSTLRVSITN